MDSSTVQGTQTHTTETPGSEAPSARRLLRVTAVAACLGLLLVYMLGWVAAGRDPELHGLDGMVRRADFVSTLTGARIIADGNGQNLYNLDVQREAQNAVLSPYFKLDPGRILPYNHIPFEVLLVTPLMQMGLPYTVIFIAWELLMLAALVLSLWTMQRVLPVQGAALLVALAAAISYQPVSRAFILGQNSPVVLLGICLVYASARRKLDLWAGLALLLVALKPQALPVMALVLLLQGRWRALLAFGGALALLSVAVMPVLGTEWPLQYAKLLVGVAGWQDTGAIDPGIMHNWRGLATNLFGGWAPGLVTPLFLLMSLLSIGLILWLWLRTRNAQVSRRRDPAQQAQYDMLWAVAGIMAVLTSLHLNPHDLTLLIFPAWIIGTYALNGAFGGVSRTMLALLWAGYFLIPLTFFLDETPIIKSGGVILSVLLMAGAALLLVQQEGLKRQDAKTPRTRQD